MLILKSERGGLTPIAPPKSVSSFLSTANRRSFLALKSKDFEIQCNTIANKGGRIRLMAHIVEFVGKTVLQVMRFIRIGFICSAGHPNL